MVCVMSQPHIKQPGAEELTCINILIKNVTFVINFRFSFLHYISMNLFWSLTKLIHMPVGETIPTYNDCDWLLD